MARSVKRSVAGGSAVGVTAVAALVALTSSHHDALRTATVKNMSATASSAVATIGDRPCDQKAVRVIPSNLSDQLRRDLAASGPATADSTATPMSREQAIAAAMSNSAASVANLPSVAVELPYSTASNLGGDIGSGPALPDGTSVVAPTRCVWVVTVHGTFVPDSGPSDEARLAHTYSTYSVAYDELSGTELWLSAGPSAPDIMTGANLK